MCTAHGFDKIKQVLRKLLSRMETEDSGAFGAHAAFYEILEITTARPAPRGIQQIKELLDESFVLPSFRLEQFCQDDGLSHAHLLRLFKKAYGTTLSAYIVKRRIELACRLLRESDLSVSSVAYSCGFADEFHFMKTFKNSMGVTALQYRKQL